MNKIFKLFMSFAVLALAFSACTPEEEELGAIDVSSGELVEGSAFTIEHDAENPNIVYLKSLMDSRYKPLWSHPQGRSQEKEVKLEIAFPGTYEVVFGVMTRGGIVYGDTATFEVAEMYPGFIEHPMWAMIAGGAGESKTWYLDLDAEGVSRYFLGPMYFFRSWYTWDGLHTPDGENYLDAEVWNWEEAIEPTVDREGEVRSGAPMPGVAAWYWTADWPGNQWMADAADFGTMTFSLQNSAKVIVDQEDYGLGRHEGTFLLDTDNHMIKFTDARPLHDVNRDGDDVEWYDVRILYLNEHAMQLGVVPNADNAAMTVYNYISEEYRDNWTPGEEEEPEPPYEGDANADLTTSTTTTKKWALSMDNPYDWTALDGTFLNGWQTPDDYTSTGWAPYDASLIENVSMTLTKSGDNSGEYSFTDGAGDEISGTYTVDDENNIVFDQSISFPISDWVSLATTADNKLRLIRTETDPFGNVNGIWLGQRSTEKAEYMVFHFVLGSTDEDEETEAPETEIVVDNSKIAVGDLEGNGNLRLEIYNEFGSTAEDLALDTAALEFSKRMTITFTLSGITLTEGAAGSYSTALGLADADWDPQYWGDGAGEVEVTGDGSYTITYEPATTSSGAVVFVIDIVGLAADVEDLSSVSATIDSIIIQ